MKVVSGIPCIYCQYWTMRIEFIALSNKMLAVYNRCYLMEIHIISLYQVICMILDVWLFLSINIWLTIFLACHCSNAHCFNIGVSEFAILLNFTSEVSFTWLPVVITCNRVGCFVWTTSVKVTLVNWVKSWNHFSSYKSTLTDCWEWGSLTFFTYTHIIITVVYCKQIIIKLG